MSQKKETTEVEVTELDLQEVLGQPGAESVMIPGEEKKPGIFSSFSPDTKFLDKPETDKTKEKDPDKPEDDTKDDDEQDSEKKKAVDFLDDIETDPEEKGKTGRPKSLIAVTKKLLDKGTIAPFDDGKPLEEYNEEDFLELYETNMSHMRKQLEDELPEVFFKGMPEEMQQAYTYIANGGTDIKGLFYALAATNDIKELDIENTDGQKFAIRAYLEATQWGSPEEIEDEILSLEDKGELAKKAKQFKPKLDAMQQEIVNQKLVKQELIKKKRAEQSQRYIENVYKTLEKGALNGIKIDNKIQSMLYAGLIQSNYPSISGKQTNMLGHLLEKYQWVEPNHELIAEALWLLADPDGYRETLAKGVAKEEHKKTMRTLKTEAATKESSTNVVAEEEESKTAKRNTIPKPKKNFFQR